MKKYLIPGVCLLAACASPSPKEENYYFPVRDFMGGKTYTYVNSRDTAEKAVWKMQTTVADRDTFFETSIFDTKNRINETVVEKVDKGVSVLRRYTLYDYDSLGNKLTASCKVIDSLVYKPTQTEKEEIRWKVSFRDYTSPNMCELSKTRAFSGKEGKRKTYSDKLKFSISGTARVYPYFLSSVYEKGKGLVSYRLNVPGMKEKEFVLSRVE